MKSVRLTIDMRAGIARDLLESRFGEALRANKAALAVLAGEIYDDALGRSNITKINGLPDGWLPVIHGINVRFGEGREYGSLNFNNWMRVPEEKRHGTFAAYDQDHAFSARWRKLTEEHDDLVVQRRQIEVEINSILAKVSTSAKLIEIWPEVAPFVERHVPETKTLPAVPTADLSAKLGLVAA